MGRNYDQIDVFQTMKQYFAYVRSDYQTDARFLVSNEKTCMHKKIVRNC